MKQYIEARELEEKLLEEISHEKFFSVRRFVKICELRALYSI